MNRLSARFSLEVGIAAVSVVLLLATLLWRDWIEMVLRVNPDHGNGSLEWLVVAVTAVAAIECSLLARLEWRRAQEAM